MLALSLGLILIASHQNDLYVVKPTLPLGLIRLNLINQLALFLLIHHRCLTLVARLNYDLQ